MIVTDLRLFVKVKWLIRCAFLDLIEGQLCYLLRKNIHSSRLIRMLIAYQKHSPCGITRRAEKAEGMKTETTPIEEARFDVRLWLAAGLSLLAGVVHWAVSPGYLAYWWGYGFFFIIAGICQIAYALGIVAMQAFYPSPDSPSRDGAPRRAIYLLGVVGNSAIVALYVVTRTLGVPFAGPAANVVLPLTPESVAVTVAEVILVVVLIGLARRGRESRQEFQM